MRRPALIPVGVAMIALAACGSGTPSTPSPPTASVAGLQNQSSSQVLTAAQNAFSSATSVQAKGRVVSDGKTLDFTLQLPKSGGAQGSFVIDNDNYQVILLDDALYFKTDTAAVERKYGQQVAALIGERWIKTTADDQDFKSFASLTYTNLSDSLNRQTAKSVPPVATTANGQPAVTIVLSDGTNLAVANAGPAYPLRSEQPGQGAIDLSNYNSVPPVVAPTDFIDLAKLQSASPTPTS
jgi:hypothetical protein